MKLKLEPEELKQFEKEIPETLAAISNLNELKTDKIAPTYQTTGITNRFLNEKLNQRSLPQKAVFKNTAGNKNGYFRIKGLKYAK